MAASSPPPGTGALIQRKAAEGARATKADRAPSDYGNGQARMDAVDDPVVEVTGLAPPGGAPPHLELLCYRAPGPIRGACADGSPPATRIVLAGSGAPARTMRDPDGHRLVRAAES
ncbi:hypothetical protein [Methylobacterium sp. R2-1]|uniref:hypothetical protein n=1 Tax=Methylobacterium sp. R2-1 TaxID=2587064 RepID=UPI00160DD83E|nr:hypothetical protein [Methylobacterium sp. R2-1]MBB2964876.1 hypothetical protein [Methylobacterium sp. R2-1]